MVSILLLDIYSNHICSILNRDEIIYNHIISLLLINDLKNIKQINIYENYPNSKFYMLNEMDIGFELINDSTIFISYDFIEKYLHFVNRTWFDLRIFTYIFENVLNKQNVNIDYYTTIYLMRWNYRGNLIQSIPLQ